MKRPMNFRYYIIFTAVAMLLLAAAACSRGAAHSQLLEAEAVMEDYPDSAYSIITAIDTTQLRSQADRALYALLLTQASYKTYRDIYSDSLITPVINYFTDNRDEIRLMKALYYRGRIHYYTKSYTKAIADGLESIELAHKNSDNLFLARGYELLSDSYARTLIAELERKYAQLAADYYLRAGKILNHRYALLEVGTAFANNREYYKSIQILDSITSLPETSIKFKHYCWTAIFPALLRVSPERARIICDSIYSHRELGMTLYDICNQIRLLEIENRQDEALAQVDSLMPYYHGNTQLGHLAARLNAHKGDYKKAYEYQTEIYNAIDSTVTAIIKQSTINAESDFHNERAIRYHRQARISTIIIWCIVAGVAIIAVALILVYREKRKRTRVEMELKMMEISELTDAIGKHISSAQEKERHLLSLTSRINSAFAERLDRMNRLCESYFVDENSNATNSRIYREITSLISDFRSEEIRYELFQSVNQRCNDALTHIREHMPQLTDGDLLLLAYVFAGFSPKSISILLNMKIGTVYMKRLRLKERIERSSIPDKAYILALFP